MEVRPESRHVDADVDLVNRPPHYTYGPIEVIDLIELFDLTFHEASAIKYLLRWRHKGGVQDLEKAIWYIDRLIGIEKHGKGATAPRGLKEELSRTRGLSREDHLTTVSPDA